MKFTHVNLGSMFIERVNQSMITKFKEQETKTLEFINKCCMDISKITKNELISIKKIL